MERPFPNRFRNPRSAPALSARERILAMWRGWDSSADEKARRPSAKSARDVIPRVLAGLHLEKRQAEAEIVKVWKHQIDPTVTAHAQPTGLHNGTLFVSVDSNVWLDEIVRYRRKEILEQLQNCFGKTTVKRISFRSS